MRIVPWIFVYPLTRWSGCWTSSSIPAEQEIVGDHVEACASCQERLGALVAAKHPAPLACRLMTDAKPSGSVADFLQVVKAQRPSSELFRRDNGRPHRCEAKPASWADLDETAAPRSLPVIAGFQIVREIGRGGMGVVYEATELALGRRVALKVLPTQMLGDPCQVRRFEREARSAAGLHHTNIVPVFGVGEHDGTHFYVMQFIQGRGLDAVLEELKKSRSGRMPEAMLVDQSEIPSGASAVAAALGSPATEPALSDSGPSIATGGAGARALARSRSALRPRRGADRRPGGRGAGPCPCAGHPPSRYQAL